ncbi:vasoactive intestinal polypeptide receptor 1 isoform X2 [Phascolarctos cinereus]|uniref:Vasoactive intestinal polypeptide receptor 1 n=1 Tax=Phascolarctos cinereus TaxID=38626 RepID=A0A6P5LAB5_PHACI|nr:vasoactive intestinal polypeptide receptor 1 isoform X2 [Phascolarctos cinereus]
MEATLKCLWVCALLGLVVANHLHEECLLVQSIELEREKCLEYEQIQNRTEGCQQMWDNITCWPPAAWGQVVIKPCPKIFEHLYSSQGGNVTRKCTITGWTDMIPAPYPIACGSDDNTTTPRDKSFFGFLKTGYTIGHSLSLSALTIAMVILCVFRKLHCTRNYIHMHLFTSFILRAVAVFLKDTVVFPVMEHEECVPGSVGCKATMVFFQYCVMANFFWLLVEGLYLHTLLAISFFSERKYFWWYILIGWGVPGLFITSWALTRLHFYNIGCWHTIQSPYWWIIKAPILASILVNFIFFILIIRILVQKLHPPDMGRNETSQYRRLAKSTLLLIPLFGVHYIMFAFFPDNFKKELKMVFELIWGSFQGFVVAVLYCFLNGEVQAEFKRKWRRWRLERFLGPDLKYHHPSVASNGSNFSTQISMLTRTSPKDRRSSSFQADFSLV